MHDIGDLPARYAERLTVQAAVFHAAEQAGVDVDSLLTSADGRLTAWPKTQGSSSYASEASVYTLLASLGCGPVKAKPDGGILYGTYTAKATIGDCVWTVNVHAAAPAVPDVPDAALMAAWRARGDNGCKDCVDRPCPACAAHLTGIAAAVLKAGAR